MNPRWNRSCRVVCKNGFVFLVANAWRLGPVNAGLQQPTRVTFAPAPTHRAVSAHARVSDHAGLVRTFAISRPSILPSAPNTASASMAGLRSRPPTLGLTPHDTRRMTKGQCGSLLLHCEGLPPSTPCRSPGALWVRFCHSRRLG